MTQFVFSFRRQRVLRWLFNSLGNINLCFTGTFVGLGATDLVYTLARPRVVHVWDCWISIWLLLVAHTTDGQFTPLPPALFWSMITVLGECVVLFALSFWCIHKGIFSIVEEKRRPSVVQNWQIRQMIGDLLLLKMLAAWEQGFYNLIVLPMDGELEQVSPAPGIGRRRYRGLFSLCYTCLSRFLHMDPELAGYTVVEGNVVPSIGTHSIEKASNLLPHLIDAAPMAIASHDMLTVADAPSFVPEVTIDISPQQETQCTPHITVFGLGSLRIVLRDALSVRPIVSLSTKQRELLAFLALEARKHEVSRDDILYAIYEETLMQQKGVDVLKKSGEAFENDVSAIRRKFRQVCEKAHIPYTNPLIVTGARTQARWSLAECYQLKDIERLEETHALLEQAKQGDDVNDEQLQTAFEAVVVAYQGRGGFLQQSIEKSEAGAWATTYRDHYQQMYENLIWDMAHYEQRVASAYEGKESESSLRRAARLYQDYAFVMAEYITEEGKKNGKIVSGEEALQESMQLYRSLGEREQVRKIYHEYKDVVREKNSGWQLLTKTVELFKQA